MAILKKHAICYRSAKYIRNCQIVILPQQKSKSDTATRKKENRQTVMKKKSTRDYRCSIVVYRGGYGEPVVRLITNEYLTNNQR
jgi:hypothetical protein